MARKTVPDLTELFKQAAEIASQVPESMHAAAFNRAIDMLTGAVSDQTEIRPPTKRRSTGPASGKQGKSSALDPDPQQAMDLLLDSIDSTQHPGVTSSATVLDRSLMILKIAHDDHGVDGLIPSDIAKILTNKFRISTSAAAVSVALGRVTNLVNRVARGNVFQYRIMAPGEEYLAHCDGRGGGLPSPKRSAPKKAKPRTKGKDRFQHKAPKPPAVESTTKKAKSSKKGSKGTGRPGAGAMLRDLVSSGFFSKARTINEIRAHAVQNLAHNYGLNELSTPLRRAIHDKFLVRTKNSDGQYEYASK